MPGFLQEIDNVVTEHYPDFETGSAIGDATFHLNILKPEDMAKEDFFEKCQQVNKWVFERLRSGQRLYEHGVGMTKKPYLQYTRSEAEIAYLRGIKQVFDPNNIMNPGKIFDWMQEHIVVLTGARNQPKAASPPSGTTAGCGSSTVCTTWPRRRFERNRDQVLRFYNERRRQLQTVQPNPGAPLAGGAGAVFR